MKRSQVKRRPNKALKAQDRKNLEQSDLDYVSDYKKALLNLRTPFVGSLIYIITALFITVIVWSHYAVIDEIAYSEGKVIPPTKVKVIQSLEGGILKELFVKEGEQVKAGTPLVQIDETQYEAQYREEQSKYLHVLASVARLRAEINRDNRIIFPKELDDYPVLRRLEVELFAERKMNLENSLKIINKNAEFVNNEIEMMRGLVKEGAASEMELIRLKKQLNDIKAREIEKKNEFYEGVYKEITIFNAELARLRQVILSRKDKLARAKVVSPVDGIVQQIHIITPGGVISPGMKIMEIVPLEPYLLVEAKLNPADIGFIRVGQAAKVKVSAYDYAIFGDLDAKVTYISADTITDNNNQAYYRVHVKTDQNYIEHNGRKLSIKVGMLTSVDIITGKKSILTYILKPILRAKDTAFIEK